jgi:hypothetical protein
MAAHRSMLFLLWLVLIASNVHPCSCIPTSGGLAGMIEDVDSVFLGRVISTNVASEEGSSYIAHFQVIRVWKGAKQEENSVMTANIGSLCGVDFIPGRTYLVFSRKGGTNWCLGTKSADTANKELKLLGDPIWQNPKVRDWHP